MYCSHCGAQIPDDSAFCPSCGQKPGRAGDPAVQTAAPQTAPPPQTSYAQPAPRYVETVQTEAEFKRDYRSIHHYWNYFAASFVCIAAWIAILIIVLVMTNDYAEAHRITSEEIGQSNTILIITFIVMAIISGLLQRKARSIDKEAENEYRNYKRRIQNQSGAKSSSSIFSDSNGRNLGYSSRVNPPRTSIPSNGWRCPDCGRVNASYVGTCACGRRKN